MFEIYVYCIGFLKILRRRFHFFDLYSKKTLFFDYRLSSDIFSSKKKYTL